MIKKDASATLALAFEKNVASKLRKFGLSLRSSVVGRFFSLLGGFCDAVVMTWWRSSVGTVRDGGYPKTANRDIFRICAGLWRFKLPLLKQLGRS